MSQSSSSKQSVVIGVLSGALVVAISAAVFLYMSSSSERAGSGAEPAASEVSAAGSASVVTIAPPSASESMKELFGLQQGAEEVKTKPNELTKVAFSTDFNLGSDRFYSQFFQSQDLLEGGQVSDSHASSVALSVITYKQTGATWSVIDKKIALAESGTWGGLSNAPVEKLQLSPGSLGLLVDEGSSGQGYSNNGKSIFVFAGSQWRTAGYVDTGASNSGVCDPDFKPGSSDDSMKPCYEYSGKISVAPNAMGDFPDLLVTRQGTQEGEQPNQVGPAKNVTFKYIKDKYRDPAKPDGE